MFKKIVFCITFLVFSQLIHSQCEIEATKNSVLSLPRSSWGQTFVPDCSGELKSISFYSLTAVTTPLSFSVTKGNDCKAPVIYSQDISTLIVGDNTINLNEEVRLNADKKYYFRISTMDGTLWKIPVNTNSPVAGNLITHGYYEPGTDCGWGFADFDMDFSISMEEGEGEVEPNNNIDVYIWAGQSNAQGWQGDGAQYPSDPEDLDKDIKLNYTFFGTSASAGWVSLQPQRGRFARGHFGPEVSFARKLAVGGDKVAIFKYSQGATSLAGDWRKPGAGGIYDRMVTRLKASIIDLTNQGYTPTIKGFVWIQGESDARYSATANAYFDNLTLLITHLRNTVVNNPQLPIILGVDEQHVYVPRQPAMLEAHHTIAANDETINFVSMIGLPKADSTHLTPDGLVTHGERIYDSMACLLSSDCGGATGGATEDACTVTAEANTAFDLARTSWGQSFTAKCTEAVSEISFKTSTAISESLTITISDGDDCNGDILHTQTIASLINGKNEITLSTAIDLVENQSYFINIKSNNGEVWKIRANTRNEVVGDLKTYRNGSPNGSCNWVFSGFDMAFSIGN